MGFNNNASKTILDKLETVYLRHSKIEVEGVAVIKLRVNNGGGDGTSCFKIKIRTDAGYMSENILVCFRFTGYQSDLYVTGQNRLPENWA